MSHATERALRRLGTTVELYNFEEESGGSRGTHYTQTNDSPQEIRAVPDPGGRDLSFGVFGAEVDADMVYLVQADVKLRDGGGEGASVIRQDGRNYRVVDVDRSQAGIGNMNLMVIEAEQDTEVKL